MTRTNFYKLPIKELEDRVKKLREWWWDNLQDSRRAEVNMVLRMAYEALQNRKEIAATPLTSKQLKTAIDVFWSNIPLHYETQEFASPTASKITPELAKETGLKKVEGGWLFDSAIFKDKTSPDGLV